MRDSLHCLPVKTRSLQKKKLRQLTRLPQHNDHRWRLQSKKWPTGRLFRIISVEVPFPLSPNKCQKNRPRCHLSSESRIHFFLQRVGVCFLYRSALHEGFRLLLEQFPFALRIQHRRMLLCERHTFR